MNKLLALVVLVACGGRTPGPTQTPDPTAGSLSDPASEPITRDPAPVEPPAAKVTGNPRSDLIPRDVLFGNAERAGVKVSPDGTRVSWLAPHNGVMNLWVAPVGKLDEAKVVTAEATRPVRQYWWAFTNKHLLFAQDIGGDENFHIFRVDLTDGNKVTDLTPMKGARAELEGIVVTQPTTIVVAINDRNPEAMDLHTVDIVTGKHTMLQQNDASHAGYVLDMDLRVRFAQKNLPDGSTQILTPGKDGTWTVYDTFAFEENSELVAIAPGGKTAYMLESRGRDTSALVSFDVATKKQKVIAEDPKADAGESLIHPTKRTVQAVAFTYDRVRWKVLDKTIAKDLAGIAKLDKGDVNVVSRDVADKTWIVAATSDVASTKFFVWDRKKQKGTYLFTAQPRLDKHALRKMTPVVLKARDGLDLVSYLTLPASADPDGDGTANQPAPMVLLVHGGPWARDYWGNNPLHQFLANRGYAVLSVNFRNSTGFGKKFINAGNLQWGKAAHTDLLDAVTWAIAQKITPADKVCIAGGSYGGYATLVGLAMTPDVFACGVDIVGPSNLLTLLGSIPPYWAPLLSKFKMSVGDPGTPEGKALLVSISPLTHAANIRRPLLIGQGANDPRVKQAESEQIVAAMKKHKLPVSYVLFPDEGHGFQRAENKLAFWGVTEAFLSAHLGGFYQPLAAEDLKASSIQIKDGRAGIPGL